MAIHSAESLQLQQLHFQLPLLQLVGWQTLAANQATQPILCLHGWLDNANSFLPLARQLPDLPLLALDFAGHGLSGHRSSGSHYLFVDYVADLVTLCRQQGWQQLTIIGHSMGGMVATALAASFPELVGQLILLDSVGFITATAEQTTQQLRKGILSALSRPSKSKPTYVDLATAAQARLTQSDFDFDSALLLAERGTEWLTPQQLTWRSDPRLREISAQRLSEAQARNLIQAVACPVFLVLAKQGLAMLKQQLALYQKDYQQLLVNWVDGGHHFHMTDAAALAHLLRPFCSYSVKNC